MAFVTKNWLSGYPRTYREHGEEHVEAVVCYLWENQGEEFVKIKLVKPSGGDYQEVSFGEMDLSAILPVLAHTADAETRQNVALAHVESLDDSAFFQFLQDVLKRRSNWL